MLAPRSGRGRSRPQHIAAVAACALFTALVMLAVLSVLASQAFAEDPFRLDSQIEDRAGALGGREAEVRTALDELRDSQRVDLWVVYVDTFSGLDSEEWAMKTADLSDLGLNDALLAVAVEDRNYFYAVDEDFPLSNDELDDVMTGLVEPALQDDDWAGAAIGAAVGIYEALSQAPVTTVTTSAPETTTTGASGGANGEGSGQAAENGGFPWTVVIALVVLAVVGVIIWTRLWNSRKGAGAKGTPAGAEAGGAMTLQELRQRVGSQLVQTDDAIKTSTEEVGFAIAEFGEAEAAPFQKALVEAHRELDAAFKLHRQFDKNADEQTQRLLLTAILQHTGAANAVLDAQVKHFDKLRDLEKQAPQVLAALEQQVLALEARVPGVREELAALAAVYSTQALKSVASNPDEAASRLTFARQEMKAGLEDVAAKRMGEAALTALAAQEAAGQAQAFLDAVGRIGNDLAEAQGRIDAAIAETQRDIAEAQASGATVTTGGAAAQLGPLVAEAQAAAAAAAGAASPEGGRDPLAALRHLEEADAALESALQQVRDERAQRAKAAVALDRTLIAARAQVSAAADYITTHRGAVGAQPRELLAEAQGALDQALALGAADPVSAARWAANAHELATRALNYAESETRNATTAGIPGMPGTDVGSAVIGAILGGILTSALGGGSSGKSGGGLFGSGSGGSIFGGGPKGGFGGSIGGGFGGGRRGGGGGFAPPSFGGTGTRMRRGGGGRF